MFAGNRWQLDDGTAMAALRKTLVFTAAILAAWLVVPWPWVLFAHVALCLVAILDTFVD